MKPTHLAPCWSDLTACAMFDGCDPYNTVDAVRQLVVQTDDSFDLYLETHSEADANRQLAE